MNTNIYLPVQFDMHEDIWRVEPSRRELEWGDNSSFSLDYYIWGTYFVSFIFFYLKAFLEYVCVQVHSAVWKAEAGMRCLPLSLSTSVCFWARVFLSATRVELSVPNPWSAGVAGAWHTPSFQG